MNDVERKTGGSRPPGRRVLAALAVAVVMAGLGGLWFQYGQSERRALRNLPEAERRALYARTLENLEAVCVDSTGLSEFCREQAEFIIQFPECDQPCRDLARRFLPTPTR